MEIDFAIRHLQSKSRFLFSWDLAMCQIFCCTIIRGVSFNYHQRNVKYRVSVSNFQVSVSAFMTKSRSRLEIWARSRSRSQSRRLRSRLHHCLPLLAVTVSQHFLPKISAFNSHMRQNVYDR